MPIASNILVVAIGVLSLFGPYDLSAAVKEESQLRVAVASNFLPTLRELAAIYQTESGDQLKIIAASTGKLYAQIIHGAPFDIFLSADSRRPASLSNSGHAIAASRFTYALGKIALWSPRKQRKGQEIDDCRGALVAGNFKRLAIANPKTAPYGVAAQQTLEQLGLWKDLQSKLVRGENIAQTLHYVDSGNAQLGIVALSLVKPLRERTGCLWEIPENLYRPIEQQAVLLKGSSNIAAAQRFLLFLRSSRATELIRSRGYGAE